MIDKINTSLLLLLRCSCLIANQQSIDQNTLFSFTLRRTSIDFNRDRMNILQGFLDPINDQKERICIQCDKMRLQHSITLRDIEFDR